MDPWKILKKLKQNIISEWRKCFLSNENCLELESSMITHSRVFDASGHTKKFTDLVVKDLVNGECFRADKLIISLVFDIIRCFDWLKLFLRKLRVVQTQAILFVAQRRIRHTTTLTLNLYIESKSIEDSNSDIISLYVGSAPFRHLLKY